MLQFTIISALIKITSFEVSKGFLRELSQLLTKYKQRYAYFTHRHITEVINRKTFTDLWFVNCYPSKCHDFVNPFIY
jgi:hypothetical protein